MPLKFSLKKKSRRNLKEEDKLYYAIAKSDGVVNEKDIARRIEAMSSLSSIDIAATIEAFTRVMTDELSQGKTVKLGELGIFYLTLQSEGVKDTKDFNRDCIKKIKLHFLANKLMKSKISKIPLLFYTDKNKKLY